MEKTFPVLDFYETRQGDNDDALHVAFHQLLDEGLLAMKTGSGRVAKDVFADIQKEFGFDNV